MSDDTLIDRIYEASLLTQRWESVLDDLCALSSCSQALLFANDGPQIGRWVCTQSMRETMRIYVDENWGPQDAVTARSYLRREPCFLTTRDLFAEGEFEKEPCFDGLYQRCNVGSSAGTVISAPDGNIISFGLHRSREHGPIEAPVVARLNNLRPHLARAALMSSRFRLEQMSIALEALNAIRLPACAVNQHARLRLTNSLFEQLIPSIVQNRSSRLKFCNPATDQLFMETLAKELQVKSGRQGKTFPTNSISNDAPHIAHLVPICGDSRDIFSASQYLIIVIPVNISKNIDTALIEGLFDLTSAEASVTGGIMSGKTLDLIARERGTSIETVRTQVKSILMKTGANRQVDLIRLLSNAQHLGRRLVQA